MKTKYGKIKNSIIVERIESAKDFRSKEGNCLGIDCAECILFISYDSEEDLCSKTSSISNTEEKEKARYEIACKAIKKYEKLMKEEKDEN